MVKAIRIILAQTNIIWESKKENINHAKKLLSNYDNADLILFPEMSFTGFSMNTDLT